MRARLDTRVYWQRYSKAIQSCGFGTEKILMGTFALSADAADAGKLEYYLSAAAFYSGVGRKEEEYGQQAGILLYMKQEQQDEGGWWLTSEALIRQRS